mgnify:CR=1 FL=1
MLFQRTLLRTIIFIGIFLMGYYTGRRVGKKEGIEEGIKLAKLEFRQELLQKSLCPVCSQELNGVANCDNIHNRD